MIEPHDERDLGAFIPADLDDFGLDPYAFRIYCRICRRAGKRGAFESVDSIAEACKMSDRKVQWCLRELVKAELVSADVTPGKKTVYRLRPIPKKTQTPEQSSPQNHVHPRTEFTGESCSGDPRTTFVTTPEPRSPEGTPLEGNPSKYLPNSGWTGGTSFFVKPPPDQVERHFMKRGQPSGVAMEFWNHYDARGWIAEDNEPVRSWHILADRWMSRVLRSTATSVPTETDPVRFVWREIPGSDDGTGKPAIAKFKPGTDELYEEAA